MDEPLVAVHGNSASNYRLSKPICALLLAMTVSNAITIAYFKMNSPPPAPFPLPAPPVPRPTPHCNRYMETTGCDWTSEWNCPGQTGGHGLAAHDGSIGWTCCCEHALWNLAAYPLDVDVIQPTGSTPLREEGSYAFVTLAADLKGNTDDIMHYWPVLPMARAIQRLSAYPLVLMANYSEFYDGTPFAVAMQKLNTITVPIVDVPIPASIKRSFSRESSGWALAWNKIGIWKLTNFSRLIWVDTDAILFRPVDWLFKQTPTWAMRDDWFCKSGDPGWYSANSGFMLLEPSMDTYHGILAYADTSESASMGDQQVIREYFQNVKKTPVKLLDAGVARYGICVGAAHNDNFNPDVSAVKFELPAFWHKSDAVATKYGFGVACFMWDMSYQLKNVEGVNMNMCHHHPVGPYWRDLFCEAVNIVGVRKMPAMQDFCNDTVWYR